MPAKSVKQARLFRAAAHGAAFPKAQAIRRTTTAAQRAEFSHVALKGNRYKQLTKR